VEISPDHLAKKILDQVTHCHFPLFLSILFFQSQALALTRAANAAAVVAAANAKSPNATSASASLADLAVKKEHSLSPPHNVVGVGVGVAGEDQHRRSSLQGVQEKLTQLQMQQQHHQQQQQQQQQQHHHHQQHQQQQTQQAAVGVGGGELAGRRSSEGTPPTAHPPPNSEALALSSSTASSSQNATPKSDRERERERERERDRDREERVERGSISCLPPAALGMPQQAEKLLNHPALDSRRDFDVSKVNRE